MAARYMMDLGSLPAAQFEELRESISGSTFLTCDVSGYPRTLDVVLHSDQTIEELKMDLPALRNCPMTRLDQ